MYAADRNSDRPLRFVLDRGALGDEGAARAHREIRYWFILQDELVDTCAHFSRQIQEAEWLFVDSF